jgi:hypothetical protein
MKVAFLVGLCLSLAGFVAAAPVLEEDPPQIPDPSWATGIRTQIDNDRYDDALAALQKLEIRYGKTFQFHTLTAEAYEGKSIDTDNEKDEIRWLKKARESYLKAESLAPAKEKAAVKKLRELVEADLKDLGAPVKAAPKSPAKPSSGKRAKNGVTLSAGRVEA